MWTSDYYKLLEIIGDDYTWGGNQFFQILFSEELKIRYDFRYDISRSHIHIKVAE